MQTLDMDMKEEVYNVIGIWFDKFNVIKVRAFSLPAQGRGFVPPSTCASS